MTPARQQDPRLRFQIRDAWLHPVQTQDRRAHLSLSNLPLKEFHPGVTLCYLNEPLFRLDDNAQFPASTMCPTCQESARE